MALVNTSASRGKNNLIIDNLYRGRFEINEELIEFHDEKGFFYLEFDNGQKIEFWSKGFFVEEYGKIDS